MCHRLCTPLRRRVVALAVRFIGDETNAHKSRYSNMRSALRAWLVLGTACGLLSAPIACSQAPQVSRNPPSPAISASTVPTPSAQVGSLNGGWSDAGALSTARGGPVLGALLEGGRVLVTGPSNDGLNGKVEIYDPGSGWSLGPRLSSDLSGAVVAPLPGGRALLAGGAPCCMATDWPYWASLATAMTYNPTTGAWTKVPNMSVARSNATATALPDGRVLVAGGFDGRLLTNPPRRGLKILPLGSSQFFNPSSSTWTTGPTLTTGRYGHSAVALKGGRVLVVGGSNGQSSERLLNTAELFDPATRKWIGAGSIGTTRTQFTLTALADGRALLAGGLAANGLTVLRSTLLYDPTKNLWSPGPELANLRTGHAAAVLADGRVLVIGGVDQVGKLASSELFDPSANSWSATGALATPRSNHLAITLPAGHILAIGGSGSIGPLASSELFDSAAKGMPAPVRVPAGPGNWQMSASIPISADALTHVAKLLPDGRVLVVPNGYLADFRVYDPKLDSWTTPFSRQPQPCNACVQGYFGPYPPLFLSEPLGNSEVLLLAVDQERKTASKAEVIDLKTGKATPVASPGKIGSSRLDLLLDGRIWLTASQQGDSHTLIYDPVANRWTASSNVPAGLVQPNADFQTVTPLSGGRMLVVGSRKAMVYDSASGRWTEAGALPDNWSGFSATRLHSGDVLLAGGTAHDGTSQTRVTSQVMLWDHVMGLLASAPNMPVGLSSHSTAVLADGRVLLAAGVDTAGDFISADPVTRAEIYDPAARSWSLAAPLPAARASAIAVTLTDGRVLLVGGSGISLGLSAPSGPQPSLLFTPQS
jgi:N-acetylneuraminic acid mutarotase